MQGQEQVDVEAVAGASSSAQEAEVQADSEVRGVCRACRKPMAMLLHISLHISLHNFFLDLNAGGSTCNYRTKKGREKRAAQAAGC